MRVLWLTLFGLHAHFLPYFVSLPGSLPAPHCLLLQTSHPVLVSDWRMEVWVKVLQPQAEGLVLWLGQLSRAGRDEHLVLVEIKEGRYWWAIGDSWVNLGTMGREVGKWQKLGVIVSSEGNRLEIGLMKGQGGADSIESRQYSYAKAIAGERLNLEIGDKGSYEAQMLWEVADFTLFLGEFPALSSPFPIPDSAGCSSLTVHYATQGFQRGAADSTLRHAQLDATIHISAWILKSVHSRDKFSVNVQLDSTNSLIIEYQEKEIEADFCLFPPTKDVKTCVNWPQIRPQTWHFWSLLLSPSFITICLAEITEKALICAGKGTNLPVLSAVGLTSMDFTVISEDITLYGLRIEGIYKQSEAAACWKEAISRFSTDKPTLNPRLLSTPHYAFFSYSVSSPSPSDSFAFQNTHISTQSITITVSDPNSSSSFISLSVGKNCPIRNSIDWGSTGQNTASLTIVAGNSVDGMTGLYTVQIQAAVPYLLTIVVLCSEGTDVCFCPLGQYPSPSASSCNACTDLMCQAMRELGCLPVTVGSNQVLPAAFNCFQCANGQFGRANNGLCEACDSSCAECVGSSSNQCISCHANASLSVPSSPSMCNCNSGYFPSLNSGNCEKCHAACASCTGAGPALCPACSVNAYSTAANQCECNPGYGVSLSGCALCTELCWTCTEAGNSYCVVCNPNSVRSDAANPSVCLCSDGYFYDSGTSSCAGCDISCKTCSGAASNQCLQCHSNALFQTSAPGICVCALSYYPANNLSNCAKCNSLCKQCTGSLATNCSDCWSNATLSNGECVCISTAYPSSDASNCLPCHPACQSCNATTCLTCKSNATIASPPFTCVCNSEFFFDSGGSVCVGCDLTCQLCTGGGNYACSACRSNASLNASSECKCDVGFFGQPDARLCVSCDSSCFTCTGSGLTACISCKANAAIASGACKCLNGFTGDPSACQPCSRTCLTCSGLAESQCETCKPSAFLRSGTAPSYCDCPIGRYLNTVAYVCSSCRQECLACMGASVNQCTTCPANSHLKNPQFPSSSCECNNGWYPNWTVANCQPCSTKCYTCFGAGDNGCVSCHPHASVQLDGSCICLPHFYPFTDVWNCVSCHATCYECTGAGDSNCISCYRYAYLVNSPGICQCLPGFFPNLSAASCQACKESCLTCSGGQATDCLSCKSNAVLNGLPKTNCLCEPHFFPLPTPAFCQNCDPSCFTCSGASSLECFSCYPNAQLRDSSGPCPCFCPIGFYPSPNPSNCVACDPQCWHCSGAGPSQCIYCQSKAGLSGGLCVCISGFYPNTTAANCSICHVSCYTCDDGTANGCTSCSGSATLSSTPVGACQCFVSSPCHICYQACLTCVGGGVGACTSCYYNAYLVQPTVPSTNNSYCVCSEGYYPNPHYDNCAPCEPSCRYCYNSTSSDCGACYSNASLANTPPSSCVCNTGYFPSSSSRNCQLCHPSCAHCLTSDIGQCSDCYPNASLESIPTSACKCNTGFFPNNTARICAPCDPSCVTCTGNQKSDCGGCFPHANLISYTCVCEDGYSANPTAKNCDPCHVSCLTCSGVASTQCVSCYTNAVLNNESCACAPTFYADLDEANCHACAPTCYRCVSLPTSCTACYQNAHLGSATSTTECVCNTSYFPNSSSAACAACDLTCLECNGAAINQCQACYPHASLQNGNSPGTCVCEEGFFPDSTAALCSPCPAECVACNAINDCSVCYTNAQLVVDANFSRVCECVSNSFPNTTVRNCSLCHHTCATCTSGDEFHCATCSPHSSLASDYSCICEAHYYWPSLASSCELCHVTCPTCTGSSDLDCLSCYPNTQIISGSSGKCECLSGYYGAPDSSKCLQCEALCPTCSGIGLCLSCKTNAAQSVNPGPCTCVVGWFFSVSDCSPCESTCLTCDLGTNSACLSCHPPAQLSSGVCQCLAGYYPNSTSANCSLCDPTCSQCTAAGPDFCSLCHPHASPTGSNNQGPCVCDVGFYPNLTVANCVICAKSCLTCAAGDDANCLSCNGNAGLQTATGPAPCLCDNGYFMGVTGACAMCHSTCSTCISSNAGSSCTSCKTNANLQAGVTIGVCRCDTRYYPNSTSANCSLCDVTCLSCSQGGSAGCSSCYANAGLSTNPGACVCNTGFLPNTDSSSCISCSVFCASCAGGSGANMCKSCHANASLINSPGSSQCQCYDGFYQDSGTGQCNRCDDTCKTCSSNSLSDCLTCKPNAQWVSGKCLCDDGFFPNMDASNCATCDPTCSKCVSAGSSNCSFCKLHAELAGSSPNSCLCEGNYYLETSSGDCKSCDISCAKCSAGSSNDCVFCHPNAVLPIASLTGSCTCETGFWPDPNSSACKSCHVTCLNCTDSTDSKCTGCKANASLPTPASSPGPCNCNTGFARMSDGGCRMCDITCTTCLGNQANECLTCHPNAILLEGQSPSHCICSSGYYYMSSTGGCGTCDSTCVLCAGPGANFCLSCGVFAGLETVPGPCKCSIDAFPSPDVMSCHLCSLTCLSCSNASSTGCLSCKAGAELTAPSPASCQCQIGRYPAPDASICEPCAVGCRTCLQAGECLTCYSGAEAKNAKCQCILGFFPNSDAENCKKCEDGCLFCAETGCITCQENLYLLTGSCLTACPFGHSPTSDFTCKALDLTPPTPSLTVTANNSLSVYFDRAMNCSLAISDVEIQAYDLDNTDLEVTWSEPVFQNYQEMAILLYFEGEYIPAESSVELTFLRPDLVLADTGIAINVTELHGALHEKGEKASNVTAILLTSAAQTAAAASKGGVSAVTASSLISGNPSGVIAMVNQLQLITYLSMTKLPLPEEFAGSLAALNVGNMIPNPFETRLTRNYSTQSPPKHVSDYGIESTLFLNNALTFLGTSGAVLASFLLIYLLSRVKIPFIAQYFSSMLPSLRWNVPLKLWLTSYLDLGVFSLLQITSISGSNWDVYCAFSIIAAGFCLFAFAVTPFLLIRFVYRNFDRMRSRMDEDFNRKWGALFMDFRQGPYLSNIAYYLLFIIRRTVLAATLVLIPDQLMLLALLNCASCVVFLLFVVILKPFSTKIDQFDAFQMEATTTVIYFSAFSFLFNLSDFVKSLLTAVGIWTLRAAMGLNAGISVVRSVLMGVQMLKLYRMRVKEAEERYKMASGEERTWDGMRNAFFEIKT